MTGIILLAAFLEGIIPAGLTFGAVHLVGYAVRRGTRLKGWWAVLPIVAAIAAGVYSARYALAALILADVTGLSR